MKNRWFVIDEEDKTFKSKRKARTEKEAWDKTLLKWGLICDGYAMRGEFRFVETCGFCNYSRDICSVCLLNLEREGCTPYDNSPDLQYLWLLFVREAGSLQVWEE